MTLSYRIISVHIVLVCRVHLRPVMASYRRGISLDSASFAGVFSTALGGAGAICKIEYKAIPADMHCDIYLLILADIR